MELILVKVEKSKAVFARNWCYKNFGPIPRLRRNAKDFACKFNREEARWWYQISNPSYFKFRKKDDAMLFKLTWS